MASNRTITIFINPSDRTRGEYLVELREGEKSIAQARAVIDRQALLEHEHTYSTHDYGIELYDTVFAGKVGREYQRLVGGAGAEGSVRVQLVISEYASELHSLPWERMFHIFGDEEAPLATRARTPFSRFLITGAADQPPVRERPLRLLVAIANPEHLPHGWPEIDVTGEVEALAALLNELRGDLVGTLLPGRSGLPAALRQRLEQGGWQIGDGVTSWRAIQRHLPGQHVLHILAHGQLSPQDGTAYLLLESEGDGRIARGGADRVADQAIVDGLNGIHPVPQLIFLAACESAKRPDQAANPFVGLAPRLVAAGTPAVIAMQDRVPIDLARSVTGDFYRRLFAHGQVDRALNEARSLVFERDQFAWAIPVLFLRLRDGRLFAQPEAGPARRRLQAPPPPASFAGRVEVLQRLSQILTSQPDAQVTVALQGIGGQGKSTVARKLGRDLEDAFPGGVLWVDVGPGAASGSGHDATALMSQQSLIVSRIALELGLELRDVPRLDDQAALVQRELAAGGRLLAILDDVWEPDLGRWLMHALLPDQRAVLFTTRRLDVARALSGDVERLDVLSADEGAELLACLLGPLGRHAAIARQIVDELDGLALALELAARRCDEGAADLPWLLRQLRSKPTLGVLTLPGQASRETSLEYTLSLSLQGLDEDLARRFHALGLFAPAPFDLAALAAVWQDADLDSAEEAARQLTRRALLQRGEERLPGGIAPAHPVYIQHALLRVYALALAGGEAEAAAGRQAEYFKALPGANWEQGELYWAQVEHAWRWVDARPVDERLDFLHAVKGFAYRRGLWEPVRRRAEELLAELQASTERPGDQAKLLGELGFIASALGEKRQALTFYEQALPLLDQVGDKANEAVILSNIGKVHDDLGDKVQALTFYEQALPLRRQVGDKAGEATTLNNIGKVHSDLGEKRQALTFYEQALPLRRQVDDKAGEATTLNNIGGVHSDLGDKRQALTFYEQALPLQRQVGHKAGEAVTLNNIGKVHSDLGDKRQALTFYGQALLLWRQVGDKAGEALTCYNIAAIYTGLGDLAQAEQLLMRTVELDEATSNPNLESRRASLEQVRAMRRGQPERTGDAVG